MKIRVYGSRDCPALIRLFRETVHTACAGNYGPEQLDAWAPEDMNSAAWDASLSAHDTLLAVVQSRIVGFADMTPEGYLDRLYVHPEMQRRGVASVLCDLLERRCDVPVLTTHASLTARPFLESRGWRVLREQQVERRGVLFTNFLMELRR